VVAGVVVVIAIVAVVLALSSASGGKEWMNGFAGTWKQNGSPNRLIITVDKQSDERGVIDWKVVKGSESQTRTISIDGDTLSLAVNGKVDGTLKRQGSSGDGLYGTWSAPLDGETATVAIAKTRDHGTTLSMLNLPVFDHGSPTEKDAIWVDGNKLVIHGMGDVGPGSDAILTRE